jgi:hypothetical protein
MNNLRIAEEKPATGRAYIWLFVGVAGLAASITSMFLAMRAVLGVGGFCADGGPFVIETPCPEGVGVLLTLGTFGWFVFAGLIAAAGGKLGGGYGGLAFLAWPSLFLALGWNFLEFGLAPDDGGIDGGFLVPGVLFWLMGGVPLLVAGWDGWQGWRRRRREAAMRGRAAGSAGSPAGSAAGSAAGSGPRPLPPPRSPLERSVTVASPVNAVREARAAVAGSMGAVIGRVGSLSAPGSSAGSDSGDASAASAASVDRAPSLVEELERLAELRRRGDLSMMEYDAAKRALIRDHETRR